MLFVQWSTGEKLTNYCIFSASGHYSCLFNDTCCGWCFAGGGGGECIFAMVFALYTGDKSMETMLPAIANSSSSQILVLRHRYASTYIDLYPN
jgi:hypothetical protein